MSIVSYRRNLLGVILSIVLLFCVAGIGGALVAPVTAPALQGITGIDALMGATCPANWRRVAPHICAATVEFTQTTLTGIGAGGPCVALNMNVAYGIPTSSQAIVLKSNVISSTNTGFYGDAACAGRFHIVPTTGAEAQFMVPAINGVIYWKNCCDALSVRIIPVMFYD